MKRTKSSKRKLLFFLVTILIVVLSLTINSYREVKITERSYGKEIVQQIQRQKGTSLITDRVAPGINFRHILR